jgi:hypothetical protein
LGFAKKLGEEKPPPRNCIFPESWAIDEQCAVMCEMLIASQRERQA